MGQIEKQLSDCQLSHSCDTNATLPSLQWNMNPQALNKTVEDWCSYKKFKKTPNSAIKTKNYQKNILENLFICYLFIYYLEVSLPRKASLLELCEVIVVSHKPNFSPEIRMLRAYSYRVRTVNKLHSICRLYFLACDLLHD